jgi:hypothetical protein
MNSDIFTKENEDKLRESLKLEAALDTGVISQSHDDHFRRKAREYVDGKLNLTGDALTEFVNSL